MSTAIKIGDKVHSSYYNRTGVVVSIAEDVTAHYDLSTKQIIRTTHADILIVKVLCTMLTLDTLKPCTAICSFRAQDVALVA